MTDTAAPPKPTDIKQEIATVARDITFPAYAGVLRETDDTLITRGQGKGLKLYDEIERDCHAYAMIQKRKLAIIARDWQVDPASTSRIDKRAAALVEAQLDAMDFDHVCLNLLDALLKGFAVGEIMWRADGSELVAAEVRPRDQRRFGFGDDYQLRLKTPDNFLPGMALPDRKFITHSFGAKDGSPYGLGLGSRLFWPVFFKRKNIAFWLTFQDKFGNPTAVGKYPPGASLADQKKLLDALAALSQDTGITIPNGMLIELLEASRSGTTSYEQLCRYMDEEITIAVLGEAASVKGGGGQAASAAITRNEVRLELVKADADLLSGTLNKTLVKWIVELNMPGAGSPRLWRKVEEPKDLGEQAKRDKTIFDMGFKPRLAYINETYGGEWEEKPAPPPPASPKSIIAGDGAAQFAETIAPPPIAQLADRMSAETAPAWSAVLNHIEAMVSSATSLEELKTMLESAYDGLPLDDLRAVMASGLAVASLAGITDVKSGN